MRDEACTDEAVLNEPAKVARSDLQLGKAMTHYWGEAVVVALALLLWLPRLAGPIDLRWDAGVYYVLGTSLATDHGYRILSEPGSPEALQYPPLLPGIVALYERALGSTDPAVVAPWLRILYAALFLVYALAVLALARKYLHPVFALMATALCLLHVWTIFLSDLLSAELPFAFVSVVFMLVVVGGGSSSPRPWLREAVSFALAAAGFLLRTAGIVLFAAWMIEALARRRWQLALARGALALLPILLWQTHVERVRKSDEYRHPAYEYQRAPYQNYNVTYFENILLLDPFKPERGLADKRALGARLLGNLAEMPLFLGQAVTAPMQFWQSTLQFRPLSHIFFPVGAVLPPIIALGTCVIAGLVLFVRYRAWPLASTVLLSIGLMCLTPWPEEFNRYLAPLAPFLTIAAVLALERFDARWYARRAAFGRLAIAGVLGLAFVVQARAAVRLLHDGEIVARSTGGPGVAGARFFHDRDWFAWEQAVAWIAAHAAPDDIVATTAPHQIYLRTGLRAVYPPFDANPVRARHQLETVPVKYVIVDEFMYRDFSPRYALPAVESDPSSWRPVYAIGQTKVYERAAHL